MTEGRAQLTAPAEVSANVVGTQSDAPIPAIQQEMAAREIGKAVKHTFVYGAGSILQKAISFLLLPVYTHYLNPRDFGILEILNVTISLIGMFLAMGITPSILRYHGVAASTGEKHRIVSTAYLFSLGTGLLVLALGALAAGPASLALFGAGVPSTYLLLMVAFFVCSYVNTVPAAYLRAEEASTALVAIETACGISISALGVYFLTVLKLSILGLLWSQFVIAAIFTPFLGVWILRRTGVRMDWSIGRKLLSFGSPLVLSNVALFILNFSDRFFLKRFGSLEAVGIYSVGYKFGYIINFLVIQPFNMMWMARMYLIHKQPNYQKIFAQVFVLYSLILIVVALAFALFSQELVTIMADSRYAAGSQVVPIVVLAYVFLGVGSYLQLGMFLASKTGKMGIVGVIAAVVNLILNYVLILRFGMIGAAWATALGFLALAAGSYYYSQRAYRLELGVTRVIKALAVAVGLYSLSLTISSHSAAMAGLMKGILLAVYPVLVWFAGILSSDDLKTLDSLRKDAVGLMWRRLRPAWAER
jgi:O-antigen/teichoic acid export membrane protein